MLKGQSYLSFERLCEVLINDIKEVLGLKVVESKKKIIGIVDNWEVDICAYDLKTDKLVAIECKYLSSRRLDKPAITNLIYCIKDIQAQRGFIVTTMGLKKGAKKIAQKENIGQIILHKDSDIDNYVAEYLDNIFLKRTNNLLNGSVQMEVKEIVKLEVVEKGLSSDYDFHISE